MSEQGKSSERGKSVTDIPIWENCPYRDKVPAEIEIRADADHVAFWWPQYELHVDVSRDHALEDRILAPVMGNLTGAVFEKEFPGIFFQMLRAQAATVANGTEFPAEFRPAMARKIELDKLVPGCRTSMNEQFLSELPPLS